MFMRPAGAAVIVPVDVTKTPTPNNLIVGALATVNTPAFAQPM
jgi:hypothetical protein